MKELNSKQKGNITEVELMLECLRLGYNVLSPYGDCERYDFVIDKDGKFLKVQSKTASTEDDDASFRISTSSCNRKDGSIVHHTYSKDEIDYFGTVFDGVCYLIPVEDCKGRNKKLRLLPAKNGQTRGITWAKDYLFKEVIEKA